MRFGLFKKKRSVDFVLSPTPEENRPVEKTDEEINTISVDRLALGPAATEQDIQNYSQNQSINPLSSFNPLGGYDAKKDTFPETTGNETNDFFPFMQPSEDLNNNLPSENPSTNYQESDQLIKLQRKVDSLIDEIKFLKRKIERLDK